MSTVVNETTFDGINTIEVLVRRSFFGKIPEKLRKIETDGALLIRETMYRNGGMNIMPYASGFQGGVAVIKEEKPFELGEFKAEQSWSKQDYNTYIQRRSRDIINAFQNDFIRKEYMATLPDSYLNMLAANGITPENTTEMSVALAELELFAEGLDYGVISNFWLADKAKRTYASGTFPNGASYAKYDADKRYNVIDGVWTQIIKNAALTPTINQVKKIALTNSAVAQVETITLSGSSGTATVTARGIAKTATFASSLTVTATNFVTAFAADYLAVGLVVDSPSAGVLRFTDAYKGQGFDAPTIVNATTDLAGSVAHTTANTVAAALADGDAIATLKSMYDGQQTALLSIPDNMKVFYLTRKMYSNFIFSLAKAGTYIESDKQMLMNGVKNPTYMGIPVLPMDIDSQIAADFGGYSPYRAILTIPENICLILASGGKFGESALWWNKDENAVRTRVQFQFGSGYFQPELIVAAYQG